MMTSSAVWFVVPCWSRMDRMWWRHNPYFLLISWSVSITMTTNTYLPTRSARQISAMMTSSSIYGEIMMTSWNQLMTSQWNCRYNNTNLLRWCSSGRSVFLHLRCDPNNKIGSLSSPQYVITHDVWWSIWRHNRATGSVCTAHVMDAPIIFYGKAEKPVHFARTLITMLWRHHAWAECVENGFYGNSIHHVVMEAWNFRQIN